MEDGIRLYALEDIVTMKLSAIADNDSRLKDFIDIAFLSTRLSFYSMLKCYEHKFPKSNVIRPILRGRDVCRYGYEWANLWIINTHNGIKGDLERIHIEDYPAIKQHLDKYWDKIEPRADQGDTAYNLRNCAYLDEFSKPKIVWGNLNTFGSYAIAPENMFINAPACMIVPGNTYLLAVLNSKIADYYLRTLGVVRNGGFFEYKPMFVEQIPIPKITTEKAKQIDNILSSSLSMKIKMLK